jgi:hypothetical protein
VCVDIVPLIRSCFHHFASPLRLRRNPSIPLVQLNGCSTQRIHIGYVMDEADATAAS